MFVFWKVYKKTSVVNKGGADIFSRKQAIDDEEDEFVRSREGIVIPCYQRVLEKALF